MVQEKIIRSMIAPVVVAGILILAVLTAIPSNALMTHSSSEYEKCVKSSNNCFLQNNESSNTGNSQESSNTGNAATSQESSNTGNAQESSNTGNAQESSNTGTCNKIFCENPPQKQESSNTGSSQQESSNTGNAAQGASNTENTADIAKTILEIHNKERAAVGVPPLVWSDKLAADAKPWAEHLVTLGKLVHSSGTAQGENLSTRGAWSIGQPPSPISTESLLQGWVNEKPSMGGHYTQMVWKTTKEVGCATASTKVVSGAPAGAEGQTVYLVCRYSPPGNTGGPPY
ncbi:MAG: CAP domain-containing protein [Candidatus Nitrosopolaris sp.]